MSILVDTNILTRAADVNDALHQTAIAAIAELKRQGEILQILPQNLYEFWVVCTRPTTQNGLGMTPGQAHAELGRLQAFYTLLNDVPSIFPRWELLVVQYQVSGKTAHDARLVAAMMVHGIGQILTFNGGDFQRYAGITVLDPRNVLASLPPPP